MILEIKKYLIAHNISFQDVNQAEIVLKMCPFCLDQKFHFYMSMKGLYHCKKCNVKGNFLSFQRALGNEPQIKKMTEFVGHSQVSTTDILKLINNLHEVILKIPTGIKYLESRGITIKTIKEFKLGYEKDWVSVPHFIAGNPISIKYRKISEKAYRRLYGTPSVLFNIDALDLSLDYVIITEGEFDTIKGHQEGIKNIVGTTLGAASFPDEWIKHIKDFKTIYICFDSDEMGQRGARKVAELLGLQKCKNIILPEKDLNDYLLKYTIKDFNVLFKTAKKFEIAEITKMSESIDRFDEWVENRDNIQGLETGFKKLDSVLKGLKNEDLIIISGASTTGKTTFVLNNILHLLERNKKILVFLLEGRLFYFIQRMMTIKMKKSFTEITHFEIQQLKEEFKKFEMYFYTGPQSGLEVDKILEKTKICKELYDIDLMVLDHLHKIVPRGRDNYSALVGRTVSALKDIAIDLKIPVVVICHIRKIKKREIPSMQDLRDSSFIHQDADVILMLWSNLEEPSKRDSTMVKVLKNKTGQDSVELFYNFDRTTGQFIPLNVNKKIKYE